jgi:TPR repeat protein
MPELYSRGPRIGGLWVLLLLIGITAVGAQPATTNEPATGADTPRATVKTAAVREAEAAYGRGDFARARVRYRALAEQRSALAMTRLARMYAAGEGGRRSEEQALYWYTKAARKGNTNAMYQVAAFYRAGRGAPTDAALADRWYRAAEARAKGLNAD